MEKKVWQGRPDGCFSVAPGLVFNFRWASPSLSERGRKSVKSIFSPKWGQKARERWRWEGEGEEKKGRSNKPDSGREEVWKWRLGREKLRSWAARHVLVIMSPPFLSRSCLYYLHSLFCPNQLFQGLWRQWRPFMPSLKCPGTKWQFSIFIFCVIKEVFSLSPLWRYAAV